MHAMQHFTRIVESVDVKPFLKELDAAPQVWSADTSRQRNVRCQRHTRNIFLRTARKPLPPGAKNANDVHESRNARAASKFPRTLAFCENTARDLGAELGRATLVALLPKCKVYPHVDAGAYYRVRDRLHLVLKSSQGSPLSAGDETVVMHEGELWAFDNKARHFAENLSSEPRVHLIFDLLPAPGRGFHVYPMPDVGRESATTHAGREDLRDQGTQPVGAMALKPVRPVEHPRQVGVCRAENASG